ncbi:CRISPR-associated helicase Cas3' [Rufibacter sp. XAAS-G3-1]|uniref:CRISPR-associated helicase Cas3' n=1 Tax=Rufibacter sp. XAAS-G3-1 TaxID=2729134 RepID=UPI0015E6DDD8|nr:CRISPR-associated helicase Cas3' [Rufibacter sp. XAAS-G3-1]
MTLYSHPGKPLIKHLEEVAQSCLSFFQNNRQVFANTELKETLKNLAFICGAFHDIGKGTKFFQHYLLSPDHEQIGPKNHALVSALFVKELAKAYLKSTSLSDFEKALFAHFVFTGVKRHHGKLKNFVDEFDITSKSDELQEQLISFQEAEVQEILTHFAIQLPVKYSLQNFKEYIISKSYEKDMLDFYMDEFTWGDYENVPSETKISYFYAHQLLYSCLLFADKTDVILQENQQEKALLEENLVQRFRKEKEFETARTELDGKKNQAYCEAIDNLQEVFSPYQHIYSLTLPTGLGKTITSFAVALEMKKLLDAPDTKLIVAIPFTSIIDQNFDVYKQIINSENTNLLLKHHHLAEPSYKINEDVFDPDKSQFLIETWQAQVVVTTFVQLIDSIFSNDKSKLLKIPNLVNSIIILDEVQTIPYHYWQLLKSVFEFLGETFNCYFIFMSATQPLIFNPEKVIVGRKEIQEIIPAYKDYFKFFNRTKLVNRTNTELTIDAFNEEVFSYINDNPTKDILVIINTKKQCLYCFEELVRMIETDKTEIYYLSTLITPFERKNIIKRIKEKKSGKQQVIISTQLIEAGVDLSVDTVFRTLAPIDAIIQAAGRANRYNEKGILGGTIFLYQIKEIARATSLIYGSDLIQKTKNVLKQVKEIDECNYLQLIESYFKEVKTQSDNYHSKELEFLTNLQFEDLGNFSLIEETKSESVFIQLNQEAVTAWEKFISIYSNESLDIREKRTAFSKIKAVFYDYVVNVPIPYGLKSILFDSEQCFGFYISYSNNPSQYYQYDEDDYTRNIGYKEVGAYVL